MRKKSLFFLLLFLVVASSTSEAKPIDLETAKQVAENWFSERSNFTKISVKESIHDTKDGSSVLYIINFIPTGFVIVSADDIVVPVLGYSIDQNFSANDHPPQFDGLLENYKSQILSAKKRKTIATSIIQEQWNRLSSHNKDFSRTEKLEKAGPLLSTNWNQGADWNAQCPSDPLGPGGHVYAGCVAVAMAQVMKHWEWPKRGLGEFSYEHSVYGTQTVNFGSSVYYWDYMYKNSPTDHTAKLLYHCGVSVKMKYSPTGSGAALPHTVYAFRDFFRYDKNVEFRKKKDYTTSEWEKALRLEIDNNRPTIYQGTDYSPPDTTGHAFVVDGYDGTSYFHVNWGWSGNYNDYFYLSELAPGTHDYSSDQGGIFNLLPDKIINVPSDYSTIQEALSSACEEITILVAPGTYYENLTWRNINSITLASEEGPEKTIIDGMGLSSVINMSGAAIGQSTILRGFTIQNGISDLCGGGIFCYYSSPMISDCIISENTARRGGGIYFGYSSNANLLNVTIINNSASESGGGIDISSSNVSAANLCVLNNTSNQYGGGIFCHRSNLIYSVGNIADNIGVSDGGIGLSSSESTLSQITITNNIASAGAGIMVFFSSVNLEHCTISENYTKNRGDGIQTWINEECVVEIHYSNFKSNGFAVYHNSFYGKTSAENCYWGHSSGPTTGLGDTYMGKVDYLPFLTEPDIIAPPIPTQNVQTTDIGCNYVKLSWDTNPIGDLDGYKVYFNNDTTGYPYENCIDVKNVTSYTLSDLIPSKTYNIGVTTYDVDGNESWYSKEILVDTSIPEIQNLTLASGESLNRVVNHKPSISFGCENSGGEYLGQIQVSTDSTFSNIDMWNVQKTYSANASETYNGEPLLDGITYFLRVRVGIDNYWSDWSILTFHMNSKSSVPDLISPIDNVIISPEVTLKVLNSTDPENDILTYSFYVYEDSSCTSLFDSEQNITEGNDTTIWTISKTFNDNSKYWWTACANDGFEDSDKSDLATFIINSANNFPISFDIIYPEDSMVVRTQTPLLDWSTSFDPDPEDV